MGQWGKERDFTLPSGSVVTILPHVETENVFGKIKVGSKIDMLIVTDIKSWTTGSDEKPEAVEMLKGLVAKYVGKPHQEWVDGND